MKKHKLYIKFFFLISLFISTAITTLNYIIDPYEFYNKSTIVKPLYKDAVAMSPGLIKNYNFDCALIGSSMSQNFLISDLNISLKKQCIKNTLGGITANEMNKIINLHIENGKANSFLLNIDFFSFRGNPERVRQNFIYYLYDEKLLTPIKYLLNFDTTLKSIQLVVLHLLDKQTDEMNFNECFSWYKNKIFSEKSVIKSYDIEVNKEFNKDAYTLANLNKSFDVNIFKVISKNKNKKFILFLPPYSIMHWYLIKEQKWLSTAFNFRKHIHNKIKNLENVTLYDFQAEEEIIINLKNYRDTSHYSPDINIWMIKEIKYNSSVNSIDEIIKNNKHIEKLINIKRD